MRAGRAFSLVACFIVALTLRTPLCGFQARGSPHRSLTTSRMKALEGLILSRSVHQRNFGRGAG